MLEPTFIRFDPAACEFPRPRLSALPRSAKLRSVDSSGGRWHSVLDNSNAIHFSRGRYALHEVYRRAVDSSGVILLPSYHCRTMVDPALALGLRVLFYPVTESLVPSLSVLEAQIREERAKSAKSLLLIVLPDYFGFAQPLEKIRTLCEVYRAELIRDLSHALFSQAGNSNGTVVAETFVASPYKFVGSEDGGALVTLPTAKSKPAMFGAGWLAEARALGRLIRNQLELARLSEELNPVGLPAELELLLSTSACAGTHHIEPAKGASLQFTETAVRRRSLAASRWLLAHADMDDLAEKRRRNFQLWLDAVAGMSYCRALFAELPDDCVPYMFPLYLEAPETHFYLLKRLGIPVGRWDELAVSDCPVAGSYRLSLIHLPCHQELDLASMTWLTTAVAVVMGVSPKVEA